MGVNVFSPPSSDVQNNHEQSLIQYLKCNHRPRLGANEFYLDIVDTNSRKKRPRGLCIPKNRNEPISEDKLAEILQIDGRLHGAWHFLLSSGIGR